MLHRLTYLQLLFIRACAALSLFLAPVLALAQAAATGDTQLPPAATWREYLWTGIILPFAAILFNFVRSWLSSRAAAAAAKKDTDTRAYVEDMLFRLVDAVGAPIYGRVKEIVDRATDPASQGGVVITGEEWKQIFAVTEEELKAALNEKTLDLVMKTIGLGAAARWIATFLVKRIFSVKLTAASPVVPTDPAAALYGGGPNVLVPPPTGA